MTEGQDPSGLDNIVVRPVYLRAVNAIVQPEQQVPCTAYFYRKWLPRLGALRWCLVLTLRSVCTQRQPDGTSRGEICRADLAGLLGIHEATITRLLPTTPSTIHRGWRALQPTGDQDRETVYLAKFIPRLRYKYERDTAAGVTRRVGYIIDVVIDDPLVPEDEEQLAVILAEQLLQASSYASPVKSARAPSQSDDVQSALTTNGRRASRPRQGRRQIGPQHTVKEQDSFSHEDVKVQSALDTSLVIAQGARARRAVNQQKTLSDGVLGRDGPVLTLTTNYIYKDISIDLTLNDKRAVRRAIAPLVEYAAKLLNDDHSTGMFYSTITQLYPKHLALFTEAVEVAAGEGEVEEGTNMGAAFVRAIKELSAEEGVPLRLGKAPTDQAVVREPKTGAEEREPVAVASAAPKRRLVAETGVSIKQVWPFVLAELQQRTTRANYEMWLRHCSIVGTDGDVVVVGAPSAFARDWVNDRLLQVIKRTLSELLGKNVDVVCEVHRGKQ